MSGKIIGERLRDEHGVVFKEGMPDRAHYRKHGDLVDIFLVRKHATGYYTTHVPWLWNGVAGLEIALQHEVPTRKLAKLPELLVELDRNFSPYGTGLFVSDPNYGKPRRRFMFGKARQAIKAQLC